MKTLGRIYGSPKAITIALVLFGVPTFAVWYWGDVIGPLLSYGVYASHDPVVLHRTTVLTQILLTGIFFLLQFAMVARGALNERFDPPFSQAVVSNLMLSREQFRMLYESSPVPYFLTDDEGNIHNPNQAALRFLEGTRDELLVANFFSLVTEKGMAGEKLGILKTKMEHAIPVNKVRVCVKTLRNTERWAYLTMLSLDGSSPVPFKHLVTLVEAQEHEENHDNVLHHSA